MKAIRLAMIASIFSIGWALWLHAASPEREFIDRSVAIEKETQSYLPELAVAIEKEMQSFLPKLDEMVRDRPGDSDFQMGAGILYSKYDHRQGNSHADLQMREALRTDPHNKAAWALWTPREVQRCSAKYRQFLEDLDRRISGAEHRHDGQLLIRRLDSYGDAFVEKNGVKVQVLWAHEHEPELYKYFADGSGKDVLIEEADYAKARETLKAKLASEVRDMIEPCNEAEKADPNNALYNYLRAHLYLVLEQDGSVMAELQKAVHKTYLSTYFGERRNAVSMVLRQGGYSDRTADRIAGEYAPIGDLIYQELVKPHLKPLCERYAKEKNVKEATEVAEMVRSIARQIREEPLPFVSGYNQGASKSLEKWVDGQRAVLQKAGVAPPSDQPAR